MRMPLTLVNCSGDELELPTLMSSTIVGVVYGGSIFHISLP
jgi:hypothetical protein